MYNETTNWLKQKNMPTPVFGMSVEELMPALQEITGGIPALSLQINVHRSTTGCDDDNADKIVATITWRSITGGP